MKTKQIGATTVVLAFLFTAFVLFVLISAAVLVCDHKASTEPADNSAQEMVNSAKELIR